jgi:ATP-dependent DNA helicase RecQ
MRNPKKQYEAQEELKTLLEIISLTKEKYKAKDIVSTLLGNKNALISSHKTDTKPFFGKGKSKDGLYWMALIRQAIVAKFIKKDIETYGVIRLTEKGGQFIETPESFMMTEDHMYVDEGADGVTLASKGSEVVADMQLMKVLKSLRKTVAHKLGVPPFIVFQDPSLEDMALKYPMNIEELKNVHGVGEGKAKKYGKEFVKLITQYVTDNDIVRPDDLVVKSTGVNSSLKLYIIQNVDRKLPLNDIAAAKGMTMSDFIKEMEQIVYSGTKLNLNYWIDDHLDEDQQEEIHEYFMEAETDKITDAIEEFEGEYEDEELRLYRIKFISDVAN